MRRIDELHLAYPFAGSRMLRDLLRGGPSRQTPDLGTVRDSPEMASSLDHLERMNLRTGLWVPLRKGYHRARLHQFISR